MGGFNFDFSSLNPYIQGISSRAFSAWDRNAARQPVLESQADRAYAEWLTNNAQKRDIARETFNEQVKGNDAARALQMRQEKLAETERTKAEMAHRYATTSGPRDRANLGTAIGGPQGMGLYDYNDRMSKYAAARIPTAWAMGYQPGRPRE